MSASVVRPYSAKRDGDKELSSNFRVREFRSKCGSDAIFICDELVRMLQCVRDYFNVPVTITSGYRSDAHNRRVGGAANSFHVRGMAADIQVRGKTPLEVYRAIENRWVPGVDPDKIGLGLYNTFVHVDSRGRRGRW